MWNKPAPSSKIPKWQMLKIFPSRLCANCKSLSVFWWSVDSSFWAKILAPSPASDCCPLRQRVEPRQTENGELVHCLASENKVKAKTKIMHDNKAFQSVHVFCKAFPFVVVVLHLGFHAQVWVITSASWSIIPAVPALLCVQNSRPTLRQYDTSGVDSQSRPL